METVHLVTDKAARWDHSFDPELGEDEARAREHVERLLQLAPFKDITEKKLRSVPLAGILQHDTRIRRLRRGEIVMRVGDYSNSAFFILSGELRVVLNPPLPDSVIGRAKVRRKGVIESLLQLWRNPSYPEVRTDRELETDDALISGASSSGQAVLRNVDGILERYNTLTRGAGDILGEMAALSRVPRAATVFGGEDDTEVLEIRWQGLRDLMKKDDALRDHINGIYRQNALESQLRRIPLFGHLTKEQLVKVRESTEFFTYGDYEWTGEYKKMAKDGKMLEKEKVIAREGDYPNGIFLVRSGFARLSHEYGHGHRTLNYLGTGKSYGLREIYHNFKHPNSPVSLLNSLRAVGYTHLLFIPTAVLEEHVLPNLPRQHRPEIIDPSRLKAAEESPTENAGQWIGTDTLEFLAEHRFFNGTAAMAIDMEQCTRCDDCVRACASTHDNNPRFLRHGPSVGKIMIANACMHCADPVCLIGCPTGAIHRELAGGKVIVNQATCVGCNICAANCPYEAIRMVETRDPSGIFRVDEKMKPIVKATKCDLCNEQRTGPACEAACPHDALKRINLNDLGDFARWLNR